MYQKKYSIRKINIEKSKYFTEKVMESKGKGGGGINNIIRNVRIKLKF